MKTLENLTRLYINKCQDYVKYRMVSDICKTKDFGMMARYFKNFAKQELTHAKIISDLINKIRAIRACSKKEICHVRWNIV